MLRRLYLAWGLALACACGDDGKTSEVDGSQGAATGADAGASEDAAPACPDEAEPSSEKHRLKARVKLTKDDEGVGFFAQNGARVHVAPEDIVGKSYLYAITAGGESVANADFLDAGTGTVGEDLSFEIETEPKFVDGPYELSVVIIVSGSEMPPAPGDLASFSFGGIEPCDPPATGVSVRFNVHGADAELTLGNTSFIRF